MTPNVLLTQRAAGALRALLVGHRASVRGDVLRFRDRIESRPAIPIPGRPPWLHIETAMHHIVLARIDTVVVVAAIIEREAHTRTLARLVERAKPLGSNAGA